MPFEIILSSWSIRKKLLLLVLVVSLPGAGIIVQGGLKGRELELENAKREAFILLERLAVQQKDIEAGTRQMLSTVARLPQVQALDAQARNKLFDGNFSLGRFYWAA